MSAIQGRPLLLGGLLAGLIINVMEMVGALFFMEDLQRMAREHDLVLNESPLLMGFFVVFGFVTGILVTWLYACARTAYRPGPATAVRVVLAVWLLWYVAVNSVQVMFGLYTWGQFALGVSWGLVEILVAVQAGAWLYDRLAGRAARG